MSKKEMLVGLVVGLVFVSAFAYAFWPFTRQSDMIRYYAPCWGKGNKIFFIKEVTHGQAVYRYWFNIPLFMGGEYFADKTEVYLCSMNYDGTDKKEIVKIGDTDDGTYWLPMYLDYCQANNLLLLSGGLIPSGGASHGMYSIRLNGTEMRKISDSGWHASWSPNGKRIVYLLQVPDSNSWDNFAETIWVIDADGKNKHKLFSGKANESVTSPIWSPKGDLIAFVCNFWIWVMKPDGSERRRVCEGDDLWDWFLDGKRLFLPGGHIYDLEGNWIKRITEFAGYISLDGKFLLNTDLSTFDMEKNIKIDTFADIKKKQKHFVYKKPNNIW